MFISVIIIAKNEAQTINRVINSIKTQIYPRRKYEIIVVSDGSSDNTVQVALSHKIKTIELKKSYGISAARNIGILESCGDIIFFIDAHMVLHKRSLQVLSEIFFKNNLIDGVCGTYHTPFKGLSNIRNIRYKALSGKGKILQSIDLKQFVTFSGGIGAFKREIFENIGMFDRCFQNKSGEDIFFELKLLNKNSLLLYTPAVEGVHYHKIRKIFDLLKRGWREVYGFYTILIHGINKKINFPLRNKYYFRFPFLVFISLCLSCLYKDFLYLLFLASAIEIFSIRKVFFIKNCTILEKISTLLYWIYCEILKVILCPLILFIKNKPLDRSEIIEAVIYSNQHKFINFFYFPSEQKSSRPLKEFLRIFYIFVIWEVNKVLDLTK